MITISYLLLRGVFHCHTILDVFGKQSLHCLLGLDKWGCCFRKFLFYAEFQILISHLPIISAQLYDTVNLCSVVVKLGLNFCFSFTYACLGWILPSSLVASVASNYWVWWIVSYSVSLLLNWMCYSVESKFKFVFVSTLIYCFLVHIVCLWEMRW